MDLEWYCSTIKWFYKYNPMMIFLFCTSGQPRLPVLLFMFAHQNMRIDSSSLELTLTTTLLANVVHRRIPLAALRKAEDCWRP